MEETLQQKIMHDIYYAIYSYSVCAVRPWLRTGAECTNLAQISFISGCFSLPLISAVFPFFAPNFLIPISFRSYHSCPQFLTALYSVQYCSGDHQSVYFLFLSDLSTLEVSFMCPCGASRKRQWSNNLQILLICPQGFT